MSRVHLILWPLIALLMFFSTGSAIAACGDINGDFIANFIDVSWLEGYVAGTGPPPVSMTDANVDASCVVDINDVKVLYAYMFGGGPLFCAAPTGCANPTASGHGITISHAAATEYPSGDSIAVPVYIENAAALAGFTLGLVYSATGDVEVTSVNMSGAVISSVSARYLPGTNQVQLTHFNSMGSIPVHSGAGHLLLKLNIRILSGSLSQSITFDTLHASPAGYQVFAPVSGGSVRPEYTFVASGGTCCVGIRGDFNGDGIDADPVDLSGMVDFLFAGGTAGPCEAEADFNGDGAIADPVDLSAMVDYLFASGTAPAACP